jgi:myo-inositol-1(or 4)-monophosphatase
MLPRYEAAARAAIDQALSHLQGAPSETRTYKTDRDYATETDYAIEDALRRLLAQLTPEVGFLGEEHGFTGSRDTYWCLDPIDGTTNYSRGLPAFGVSLALVAHAVPVAGEIALPALGERYATRSESAHRNDVPVMVSDTSTLADALVSLGDFATGPAGPDKNRQRLRTVTQLADRIGRVRMFGSAAVDLAWLAAGHIDGVVIHSNKPWDMAAGVAIARASGATVTHHDGSPYTVDGPDILAAAPGVHSAWLDLLNPSSPDR